MEFFKSSDDKFEQLVYISTVLECLIDKKGVDNPIENCGPKEEGNPDYVWQENMYSIAVVGWKCFNALIWCYYLELWLYVCIGASQISSMGDLSLQLFTSVKNYI
jgi:hypothetical protein